MSPYTTMKITRADALAEITRHVFDATDEEIEEALFELVGRKTLNNFSVVTDYDSVDVHDVCYVPGCLL